MFANSKAFVLFFYLSSIPASHGVQPSIPTMPPSHLPTPPPSPQLSSTLYRTVHSLKKTMSFFSNLTSHSHRAQLMVTVQLQCRDMGGVASQKGSLIPFMWSLLIAATPFCRIEITVRSAMRATRGETGCGNCLANTR